MPFSVKKFFVTILIFFVVSTAAIFLWASPKLRSPSASNLAAESFAHQAEALQVLWPAPAFEFLSHRQERVSQKTLLGKPWVANFIFTTCRSVCPLLTTKMVRLQKDLAGIPVEFVSFSVDPTYDTPKALAAYAQEWNAMETRWHLLQTSEATLPALVEGFRVVAQKADAGPDAVFHSQVFVLVDARGDVRGMYDLEDSKDFRRLATAVRNLTASPAPVAVPPRSGATLYSELSCGNCHLKESLAPSLAGLVGKTRLLDNALTVLADEAYLRESIVAPDVKRVKGYPLHMPSYEGHLSAGELDALVQHLLKLPIEPENRKEEQVKTAVDPICHMEVRVTPDALSAGGHYFCSEACRDEYTKKPTRRRNLPH